MPKEGKPQKIKTSTRLPVDIRDRLLALQTEKGLENFQDALNLALTEYLYGKTVVDKSIPENCKTCDLYGGFFEGKVYCVLKIENKPSTIKKRSLIEAQACSTRPTLITLFRKEEFEHEINNITRNRNYYQQQCENVRKQKDIEIERLKKPIEALLNDKNTLELKVSDMGNALLERDEKIAVLETDNEQLRIKVEELSHDPLFEQNQLFKVQLSQKESQIADYKREVEKLEALRDKERQTLNEVVSKTNSVFRDFKQFLPKSYEAYDVEQYIKAMQKKIEQFEGYLATISS